jgi:subtilisin family serine protease
LRTGQQGQDSKGKRKVIILEAQSDKNRNYEQMNSVATAIRTAIASDVVVCVAAGNADVDAGIDDNGEPFEATGSILVGATERRKRALFSNYGSRVVACAPGDINDDVTASEKAADGYTSVFGATSSAVAKVGGLVALMLQANPALQHEEVVEILRETGRPVEGNPKKPIGGLIDAVAAVAAAKARRRNR